MWPKPKIFSNPGLHFSYQVQILNITVVDKSLFLVKQKANLTFAAHTPSIKLFQGFPGGTVVKNSPANAVDTGSSPGP